MKPITVPVHIPDADGVSMKATQAEFTNGGSLEMGGGGPTEEGFYIWSEHFWCEDGKVLCEYYIRSRDCDGPHEETTLTVWDPKDQVWERLASQQRDHFAERMGY